LLRLQRAGHRVVAVCAGGGGVGEVERGVGHSPPPPLPTRLTHTVSTLPILFD
jgi:hypothetical protein